MHAGYHYDLYGKGKERILVDNKTSQVSFYYTIDGEVALQ
jgi:hypothetical protein